MTTTETAVQTPGLAAAARWIVAAPVDPQTYKNLLYLALAFPLGLAYFVGLVTKLQQSLSVVTGGRRSRCRFRIA